MACTKIYRLVFGIYQNVPPDETGQAKAQRRVKFFGRAFAPLRPLRLCVKC